MGKRKLWCVTIEHGFDERGNEVYPKDLTVIGSPSSTVEQVSRAIQEAHPQQDVSSVKLLGDIDVDLALGEADGDES